MEVAWTTQEYYFGQGTIVCGRTDKKVKLDVGD